MHRERKESLFDAPEYGAVHIRHIRTYFHKEDTAAKLIVGIKACIRMAEAMQPQIRDWWIVADKQDIVGNVTNAITFTNIHHAYNEAFRQTNYHSMEKPAIGKFGHEKMSGSILDWMVVHESSAAIVTSPNTAYGNTGGRGRGKILLHDNTCPYNFFSRPQLGVGK